MASENKIVGIQKSSSIDGKGLLLITKEHPEGQWWNSINPQIKVKYEDKGHEVELTVSDQIKRTFTFLNVLGNANSSVQIGKTEGKIGLDRDRMIVRQNSLSQSSSFIKLCIEMKLLKESLCAKDIEELYFDFAKKCEEWVFR